MSFFYFFLLHAPRPDGEEGSSKDDDSKCDDGRIRTGDARNARDETRKLYCSVGDVTKQKE